MTNSNRRSDAGWTFLELLFALAIFAILMTTGTAALLHMARRAALRGSAFRVASIMRRVQDDARTLQVMRGVRFWEMPKGWQYAVYEDGDGDGVRNNDIASGVDPIVEGPFLLANEDALATIGTPAAPVPDPDTGKSFAVDAPVNFNQSSICSFSPDGSGTPGSVFLVDGNDRDAALVRSSGAGGAITVYMYGMGQGWKSGWGW